MGFAGQPTQAHMLVGMAQSQQTLTEREILIVVLERIGT